MWAIIAAVIAVAASAGVYYQQRKMEAQAKKQAQEAKAVQISGHDSNRGLYTVYGKALVGSTTVWKKVSDKQTRMTQTGFTTFSRGTGDLINGTRDLKSNRFLYRAVSLCAGPIQSVENILIDDEGYQSSRFGQGDNRHFAAAVSLGPTAGQNFSAMRTSYSDFNAWGTSFTGKGVAYAIERLYLDNDKPAYQGEPSTKYLVKGRKLYDPRKDSTSSVYDATLGTSSHRFDTPSTWEWSDNPVLALLDYMTNAEYGRGLALSVIDLPSIADSADKCDVLVDIPARLTNTTGSSYDFYDPESGEVITVPINTNIPNYRPEQGSTSQQKRFRINIAIDPSKELLDNIQEILNVFRGNLSYANGKYRVHMADVASPVLTIGDDDIITGLKISNGDRAQRMNRATVKFINANKQHKTDQASWPSLDSNEDDGLYDTYVTEDQGEKLHKTFTIKGCTDFYQAQDTAEFLVRDSRSNLTVAGTFGSRCFGLVPGDIVSLTYDSAGYSGKYFRVMQVAIDLTSMNVNLQLKEYDSSVYTWNDARGNEPEGLTWQEEVVNASPTTPVIGTLSSATRTRADGSTALTLTVPFSNIPEQAQYVDVEWGIDGTDQYNSQVVFDTENINQVEVPIERDNQTYAVRVRYFIADSAGTLMASTFATDTITVGNLTGTKLGGIEEGATANTIYQQADEPTGGTYNDGDIWIDTDDGYRMYLRSGGAWVDRADTRIATAITDAAGAQATADGKVVTFFQDAEPADASSSTGDLWIDTDGDNKLYRYNGTSWDSVRDAGIASAISSAATAQSTADGKIVTFYQDDEPAAASSSTGDLWFDTNGNNELYRYNGTDWVSARDAGIATALSNAASAQSTADGKIVTFYQDAEPTTGSEGDLWIDTDADNKLYRYDGSSWTLARDSGIASAISNAATAQATADGKVTTFYAASTATPTPEGTGDLWYQTDTQLFFRYNGSAWQEVASYNTGDLADLDTVDTDQIQDDAVTIDKIANTLQSTNYSAGTAGWKLTTDGTFEAGNGTFRGALTATSLTLDGTSIAEGQLAQGVQDSLGLADSALQIGDIAEIISEGNIPTGQLTFNDSGSKTVSYDGNDISVTGGNDNSWDTQVYSSEHYASPCVLQFETTFNSTYRFMMGLNEDPTTNASYASIDYSWYLNASTATIYENGSQVAPDGGSFSYSVGDKFSIVYDGDNVYYYHNDTLKRTVTGVGAKDFYLDSSLYDTPLTINDVRFAPISRIDYGSIGGVTITPGKLYQGTGTHNNTNTGFYLDSSGKFSLKDKLSFDGTTLSVDGNVTVDEFVKAGSGSTAAVMSGRSADNFAFWAGADFDANGGASGANAPFRVTRAGKVIMTNFALYSTSGQKLFDSTDGLLGLPSTQVAASTGSLVSSVSDELTGATDYATIQLSSTQTITVDFDYPLNYLFASGSSEANAYGQIATSITVTIQKSTDASTWSTFGSVTFNKTDSSSASTSQYYVQKQTVYLGSEFGGGTLYFASLQPGGAVDDGNVLNGNVSASLATGTHYLRMQVTYGGSGLAAGGIPSTTAARSINLTTSGAGFTVDSNGNVSDGVSTSATTGWVLSNFVEKTESDNVTINGTLTLGGDLLVNGTTTTINSTTMTVNDKNIVLADGAANAAAADGAGITIDGADASFTYNSTANAFQTNKLLEPSALRINDSSDMGFGVTKAGSTVGHNATVDEGIFWHTTNDYGIYRTAGTWASPDYPYLKIAFGTGIKLDGGTAGQYTHTGVDIVGGSDLQMAGNTVIDASRNITAGTISATGGNSSQWNTAYGWGDHSTAGYQAASTALTTSTTFGGAVSGAYNSLSLTWATSDTFVGTYSLVWNASNDLYTASWLQVRGSDDSLLTRNIVADGSVDASGGYKESGSVIVDSSGRFYVGGGSIQHSSRISFLDGSNGSTGSGAQGIAVQSLYAGTSYNNTAPSGMVNALNGYQVGNTTVINASRQATFDSVEGTRVGVNNTSSTTKHGLALYGGYGSGTNPTYGLMFTGTSGSGTHGYVNGDWATYFTMDGSAGRGWIFRNQSSSTNVASINNAGEATFSTVMSPVLHINRAGNTASGINWYSSSYKAWTTYMTSPGANTGPWGNITAPSGTLVTSWALRSFIENAAGYGWTFESGSATGNPTVKAEIRSSDGSASFAGNLSAGDIDASGQITGGDVRVRAGDGEGYGFWSSALGGAYRIYMSAVSDSTYGGRVTGETTSDYNMYFKMQSGTNRGFVFRTSNNNFFSINPNGVYSEIAYRDPVMTQPFITASGSSSSDDQLLTRWRYANANSYYLDLYQRVSSGQLRWGFSVHNNGSSWANRLLFKNENVGIGGLEDPAFPLHVNGTTAVDGVIKSRGGHSGTRVHLEYRHSGDSDANNGDLVLWASEPGITYYNSGIGGNIHPDGQYYGRADNNKAYGVYMRFDVNAGRTEFWNTTGSAGTTSGQGTRRAYIDAIGGFHSSELEVAGILTLGNSSDRSGLLNIVNTGQSWTGIQLTRSAGDHWSVMGDDANFGLYDDQNSKWILLHDQNGATHFYHNGNEQFSTQSNGIQLEQFLVANQGGSNRDSGYYGVYSPIRLAHIWSMGTAYKIAADGTSASSIYGLTYSYNPNYQGTGNNPGAISGLGHQMQWRSAGATHTAIGTGVYTIGNVTAYSDRRVKTNIQRIPDALNKVCKLNGYTYERTDLAFDEATGEKQVVRQAGVIAQEVLEVLPEVVTGSEELHYGVAYGNMVSLLIEAIKELKDEVDSLKSQLKEKDNGDH